MNWASFFLGLGVGMTIGVIALIICSQMFVKHVVAPWYKR